MAVNPTEDQALIMSIPRDGESTEAGDVQVLRNVWDRLAKFE